MFSTVLVVLFCGLVLQQTSLAEENYGYIMNYDPCTTVEPVLDAQSLDLKFIINCTTPIMPFGPILKCARFPEVKEDPLPCAKRKYKVAVLNLTEQVRNQVAAHERLARYASNISEECRNDVAEMICKKAAPACDRNETKVVELVSRQDCERILSCLNTTPKVENLKEGMLEWCRHSPDANTAKKIPLSLVYTEFEDNTTPQTYNDTKTTTAPASESPVPNKTVQTERRNASDESYDPKTTTRRPYINTTDHTTSQKPTTKPENTPTPRANISKQNAKFNPLTQTPTVNATYQEKPRTEKYFPNLKPTTESVLNLNETTQDHHDRSELNETTPHVNVTSSPLVVSRVNATARPVLNVTATRHTVSVGNSTNVVKLARDLNNKAAQLNPRVNELAISLLISILTICMW